MSLQLPRASWSNLLATSPMVVNGQKLSSTAVEPISSANMASGTTGAGVLAAGCMIFDGGNFQRQSAVANIPDASSGGTIASVGVSIFNGTSWDRVRGSVHGVFVQGEAADGATNSSGPVIVGGQTNGTGFSRLLRVDAFGSADGQAITATNAALVAAFPMAFNGASYDRQRNNSAADISATTQPFSLSTANPGEWTISNNAGAGNQSTASKAAGAAGVRHVLRAFLVSLVASVAATTTINIRDGATGAGTVLWTFTCDVPTLTPVVIALSGLNIFGSAATAMTIEQSAGVANITAAVNASGYSTV